MINISQWRCDALIIAPNGITAIPLSTTTDEVNQYTVRYLTALYVRTRDDGVSRTFP